MGTRLHNYKEVKEFSKREHPSKPAPDLNSAAYQRASRLLAPENTGRLIRECRDAERLQHHDEAEPGLISRSKFAARA